MSIFVRKGFAGFLLKATTPTQRVHNKGRADDVETSYLTVKAVINITEAVYLC
jgi:hypothetical protein